MAMSSAERQRRWLAKNRAAFNLKRRNARKGLVGKEAVVQTDVPRIEMESQATVGSSKAEEHHGTRAKHEDVGSTPTPQTPFVTKKVGGFRMIVLPEEKPSTGVSVIEETRSVKDVVGGIYRNDFGGVISKSAWEKLQKAKQHAKENNFEMDEYSQ